MPAREIVTIGHDALRQKAESVPKITKRVQTLIKDMIETMYEADGVGLAAPQVGVGLRVIVIDVGEGPIAMVNPRIVDAQGSDIDVEGCLSVPGVIGYVRRHAVITVEYMDEKGKNQRLMGEELLARAVQHELDHLDGVLFVDKLAEEKQQESANSTAEQ